MGDEGFSERKARRAGWPAALVRGFDPGPSPGPADATSAWDAVMELTAEAYALAGYSLDPVPRHLWPTRLFRPGESRPDSHGLD